MFFDFEDYRPDTPRVETAISRREGILLSVLLHVGGILLILFGPSLNWGQSAAERARLAQLSPAEERESSRFVFVQPRVETPALRPPPLAFDSDKDREARSRERNLDPEQPLPFSRGNSPEPPEEQPPAVARVQPGNEADAEGRSGEGAGRDQGAGSRLVMPNAREGLAAGEGRPGSGGLGEALRNLKRYTDSQQFESPQGGGQFGPEIQFNTRGVEFGPWVRRFVAQVKRNWFIPYAAMAMSGHVVITFNVHKDGSLTDLDLVGPCPVESFNHAAYNALAASNPTQPLPEEYPAEHAFFTVTFYYNETPPLR
jgi:TonB family protein